MASVLQLSIVLIVLQNKAAPLIGLLLASGRGQRFDAGGHRNKLLASLPDGQTVVVASARAMCAALDHVVVVVPARGSLLEAALVDLPVRLVRNARAKEGMGASIAVGVHAMQAEFPDAEGWVIALADMPFIAPETIRAVAEGFLMANALFAVRSGNGAGDETCHHGRHETRRLIAAPTYRGRRGHPVAFSKQLADELLLLSGDVGASALLARHPALLIECDDGGIVRDIDTPADLAGAANYPPRAPSTSRKQL